MQGQPLDLVDRHPGHGCAFVRPRRDAVQVRRPRNDRRIGPVSALRTRLTVLRHHVEVHSIETAHLLAHLPQCRVERALTRVDRTTGYADRAAVVDPVRTFVEQHMPDVLAPGAQEQTGRAVAAPVTAARPGAQQPAHPQGPGDGSGVVGLDSEADLHLHLEVRDLAVSDVAADRANLEPVEVAHGLGRARDAVADRLVHAFAAGSDDLGDAIRLVSHGMSPSSLHWFWTRRCVAGSLSFSAKCTCNGGHGVDAPWTRCRAAAPVVVRYRLATFVVLRG